MRRYTRIFTTLVAIFSVHFAQAQCPVPASAVAFTASANNICAQTNITFTVTNPDNANYIYTWDFDDASSGASNTATGSVVSHSFSPNVAGGSHNVKVTATPRASLNQAATWTNVDPDLTASGNTLFRNDGSGSGWNAGAESTQSITDGMFMEFTAGPTSNRLMAGLGNGNVGNDGYTTIDYAIYTRNDGTIRIHESGPQVHNAGSYAYDDTLRVGVENGVVRYYRNGTLIYTSSNTPTLPMFVDLSIRNQNDTLHNVMIGYNCTGSDSLTINTLSTPNIDVTGTWDRCIAVDNLGFTNTIFQINNHDPSTLYTWDFGDGTSLNSFADIQTHTYTTHGVYTVTVSATNAGGCTGTYTNQVLYLERPLANMVIVGTADICEGDTIFVANNTDTTNINYYVMDWGDGVRDTIFNTDTLSHVYNFSDAFACTISQGGQPYDLTLYAVNECFEHTNGSPITVTATPRADFTAPTLVCEATNNTGGVNFSASICPPPADIFSDLNNYIWDFGDPASGASNSSTFSTPTHTFTSPGNYEVTVQLITNCGTFYDTMRVRVLDDPEAGYTFLVNNPPLNNVNGDGCAPIDVQFTNTTTGDSVTYAWTVQTDVVGGVSFLNGTSDTSTNPEIQFSEPGSYIVTLTATNQCTATTFVDTITVLQGPNVTINPPSPTCDTFYYTPDVVYDAGGGAILTYDWSFPGATPATSNVANPTNILYTSSGTYTAIVEITNECTSVSDTIQFYVPLTPDPVTLSANGNQNTCVDAAAFTLSADSTGGTWSGTGITNSSLGTFNPAVAGVGTHTITYIYNPRVCPDTSTIDITVNALPTVDAAGDLSMCYNDGTVNLTGATPAGGTWSGTGITNAAMGTFDPTVSDVGVFPITYSYTDGNGCTNTDNRDVRVFALPTLNVGPNLVECDGPDDITLNAAPTGGTWSGTGITNATGVFNTQTAGGVGNYDVYYDYTDGNGCTNQDTLNIDVITGTPVSAGNDTTQCVSGTQLELVNGTPAGGIWSGAGVFNNSGTYFFYPSVAGTGFHTLTYSLGSGSCEETDVMIVTVIDVPAVDANTDTSVCVSSPSFEMTGFSPAGGTWSGTGITGTTFDPSTGVGTYPLVYSYTDPITGCENTDTRQIVVNGLPTVITSGAVTECDNASDIQLTGFSPGGGTWSGAGIVNASLGTFNTGNAGGLGFNNGDTTYNLMYVYTDANGCIDSSQTAVTVIFGDVVDAGPDNTICINNGSFALVGFTPNDGTGTWSGTGVAGTSFFPAVAGLGTHTLTYTYGSGSCEKTDTRMITVIDIPSINAGNDTLVCEATGSFTLVPFHPTGGTWTGTGVSGTTFDPVTAGTGSHTLTYSFTDAVTGCENTDTKVITVAALPSVLTNGMDMYCIDSDNITLTNYSPAGGVWTGAGVVDANNGIFNGTTAGGLGFNNADTTYPVTYTYTDGNGCANSDVLTVMITAGVDVEAGPLDTVCEYESAFIIQGFSPAGGIWSGTGITNANTGQFTPGSVAPGDYQVTYTVGSGTCERSDVTTITVGATPVVNAGADTSICEATGSFTLWNYSPAGGTWSSASAGLSGSTFDPVAAGTGTHILTYTYIDPLTRCENFDTKNITVTALPNVITTGPIQECISPDNITLTGYSPITGAGGTGVWAGTGIVDVNNGIFNGTTAGGTGVYNLTYTYTDNNGCIDSSIMQVTVVDSVTVEAGPLDTVCQYDTPFTINGFSPAGGIWTGTGISNANTGQYNPGSVAPGTYDVIYTIGSGTCERSDTTSIMIVPTPTVEAGSDIEICADSSSFTLTGFSPTGGTWSGTGITDSINGVFDPQVAGSGIFTITYTYAEPINGCENTDTRTITINALPTITMPDTMMYCNSGGDITLSGYTPTGGIWQGTGITDANNGTFNTVVAGGIGFNNADTTYPVLYIYTDNNGCIDSADLNVTLIFGDTIDAGPDLAMCITDAPDTLTSYIPTSGGSWSGVGIVDATNGVFDPSIAGAGTWTLTYTHGTNTCLKMDTRQVLVGAVPTVLAGSDLDYCISDSQDTLTGFSPANGIWSGTGITDTVNGVFDPATAGAGSYLVTYTFTHPVTGCVNSDNRILDVNPLPVVDAGDSITYCFNVNNVTLSNYSPLGGTWSGAGIVDATNGIFNSVNAGGLGFNNSDTTYPVVYTVTSGDGCIDDDTLMITVEFGDTVDAGGPFGVCIDDGLVTLSTLTPAFTPSTGGTWTGPGIVDGVNGIFDPTAVVSNTSHTLVYTFGTGTCQKTDSTTIFVGTIPFVEAGNNDTICSADPPITLSGFVPNNGGTWSGTGITDAAGIFDPSVSGAGTFTLTYTFLNTFTGCENFDTKLITVRPAPIVSAGNDRTECNNTNDITLSGYSPLGGVWTGSGIIDANNGIFNSVIAGGVGANNADTIYQLTYTYTDAIGCVNSDSMLFTIQFGDDVDAGPNFNVCENAGLQTLNGTPAGGTWSGTGIINPSGIFDPSVPTPGAFYTLSYTYGTGSCQKTDQLQVFVSTEITVEAGPDTTVCITNPSFILTGNSPSGGGTWSGIGIVDATTGQFDPQIAGVGNFVITYDYVNGTTGCQGSDTRTVSVVNAPIAEAGGPVTFCNSNNNITLTDYVTPSPAGGTWSGIGIVDGINGVFNTVSAGGLGFNNADTTYKVVYNYSSGANCTDTDTLDITVIFGDVVSAGPDDTLCIDDGQLTLVGSPAGGTWSGPGIIDAFAGTFDPTVSGAGFITVTYTSGTGTCEKSDDKVIWVGALPVILPGPDETVCIDNGVFTLSGFSPQGGTWSGTGITNASTGQFDPASSGLGVFTLTYVYANPITGCDSSVTKTVTVNALPNVVATPTVEYCITTADVSLAGLAAPAGGTWSGTGVTDPNGTFNPTIAGGIGSYTLTYSYTDGNSCTNTDNMIVNVVAGDAVDAGPNDTLCIDDSQITLVGTPAGGTWSGTGITDANLGLFNPATAGTGIHTITYTFGAGTCERTDQLEIFVGALPTINPGANDVICVDNGALTLSGYSPQGGVWSGTGITDGNAGTFDPSTSGVGTFTLTYVYANPITGCDSSVTKTVTVNPLPTVTTTPTVEYCNTTADISLAGLASPVGGTWSGTGVTDPNGTFNASVAGGIGTYILTYSYTDGNSCTNTSTMTVDVVIGDIVSAGNDDTLCIDDSQITLVGTPAGGTWSGTGIVDANLGIFNPGTAGAGLHTLTYTYGTGTCEKSDDVDILVGALPIINPGADEQVCIDNGAFTLSGFSPQGGIWSGTGITNGNSATFDPSVSGVGTFTLTYVYANPITGCDSSVTKQVTVSPLPTVVATDTVEFCNNVNDISLSGLAAPNGGTWSGTGVVNAAGLFNSNVAGGLGTYTLTYSYTDGNGCTNTDDMVVSVIFGDTVEAGPDIAMCVTDGLINMTGFSPLGGTWSGNGIIDASNGTFDPTQVTAGFHTLTYTFGTGSCEKTDTRTIYVDTIPVVIAGPDISVCQQNDPITISTGSPAGGFWTGIGVDSTGGFVPQNMSVGTFSLTYTYVNTVSGCRNTDILDITVEAPPAVDAGPDVTYCNTNQNITLSGYTPTGGLWNGAGIVDGINGIFNTQTAGGLGYNDADTTYPVVYTFTSNTGCFNRDTVNITVEFGDLVIAGTPDTICIDNGQFVLGGYSPVGGTWSGTGITDPNLGIFDPTISGTGTHTLTYTFGTGTCEKSETKTIFVDALPIVSAGVDETICINSGTLTMTGFTPQGGTWSGIGITDASAGIFDPSVSNLGTFTITYSYSNPITGCTENDIKLVTVAPLPNVTAGGTVTHCNTPNQIALSDYTNFSPNGGVWSGSGIVDANNGIFSTVLAGGLGYNGADTTYLLTYTYTDGNGCSNSDILTVTVEFGDTVEAGPDQSVCIDAGLITLTGFSPAGGSWSGNGITSAGGVFDPTAAGLGTHTLTYTFGTGSCQKTDTKTIFVGAPPVISAGVDETVCIDNGIYTLSGFSPFGGYWLGTGVDSSGSFDPSVGVGNYTLTYTFLNSVTGCEVSDTKVVTVAPLPTVTTLNTVTYCDIASNITLAGYTPSGGIWTGPGIVDGSLGLFNTTQAGGLAFDGSDTTYTLTYTYTDGNGCVNSSPMDVVVTFGDTVVAGPDEAICIDAGLLNLTDFSPAGGTWSGAGIIDPIAGVFDPQQAGAGNHVITYTFGTQTCEKSVSKVITVGTDPIVEAGPDLTACIDEIQFQLTNYSPLGGTWSGVGITDAINGFFDPATAGAGTWTLTYTFINSITGCEANDTRVVTIHPLPVVTAPDSLEFCNTGTNISLSGYSPIGGTWIGSGIVDQNNGIFNTQIAGGLGVYPIEYRYTDVNGCQNNDTTIITVIFGDTVEAGPDLQVCISDAPFVLTGFQPVGATWTGNGITDPSGVFDPQAAGAGLHTITVSFGSGTCLKTDTRDIFVGEIPTVLAGADDAVCGQDADYQLAGFSPPGGYWIGVGVDSSGLFSPVAATPGTWTLTYTYVNPITGCQNSDTKEVFVETPPAVDAGGTVTFCNSTNNITLDQHTPTGGVWSGAGIVDGLNGIFNTTAAGGLGFNGADTTYRVVYEFTSSTGCFGRDTLDIIVTFGDTVYAGIDDTLCLDGGQLTLVGSPAGGIWSGLGIIDSVSGTFDPVVAGTGLRTLTYTFGQETCEKSDVKTIFVGPLPIVDAGVDELICVDQPSFALSNFSPQGGYWIGVGVDSAGNFDPATAGVGTWTLTYTFVNSITGCDNTDTKTVTVAPLPTVTVPSSVEYCSNPNDITLSGYSPTGGTWSGSGIVSGNAGIFSTVLAGGLGFNGADTTYPVIYTFTDNNGCTNRDTMDINVIFGDTVDAGPDISVCITDGLITLTGYTPTSSGTWTGTGIVDANAGIFDPNLAGGGTHVISYTFGTGTCEKTDTRTIFVGTIPAVDAGPDILVCADQTAFSLTSYSPIGGTWVGSGITDDTLGIFDPQVTGDGTFVLTYTYINDVTGCENFDTREVVVAPLPIVNVDDSLEFCINNNNIPLTDYVSTTPSTGVTWSGSGIVDPVNGIFNATIAGGIGQYVIDVNFTDANGCSNMDSLLITVIFGDTVEAGPDDTLCINDNPILLTGFSPIGGTFSGAGVDAVSNTFDPATAGAGLHIITYTFGTGTCEKTDTRTILVGDLPTINIGNDQTICIDAPAFTLTGYSPQGGTWSGVGITDPVTGIFNVDSAGVGTHILTYTFANSITGCENTAQRTITVAPLPIVEAGAPILICDNPDDYTIPTSSYSPNGGQWSGAGIVNSTSGVFNSVIAGGIGYNNADTTYPVIYTFTDGNGCTNFDTLDITVEFGDTIYAGPNEALCIDIGVIQLTGFLPTSNFTWSGPGIVNSTTGQFDPQAAGPGAHTITISTGVATCAKTDDKIIFVGTPPAVNPGNDQAVCEDDSAFTFAGFSPPGGVWTGTGITDSLAGTFDPQLTGTGTFVLTYTFVNSVTNCETAATKTVTVNPLPFVDAGDTVQYCDNPNDIVLSGYTPAFGGFWSGPGVTNPSQGIFNTGQAGGIGVYNLAYDYTDPFTGCSNNDTLVVDVIFGDTVVAGPNDTLCIQDLPITLQGSPAGGTWSGTGITNGNLGIFNPAVAEGGTHVLTYTFGTGTCEKMDTKIIFVGEPDPLDAGNDQIVCVDAPSLVLTASLPDGVWSGNGITDVNAGEFTPSVAQVGFHNIVYTYTNQTTGCVSMDTLVIEVKPLPVVNTAGAITYCEADLNVTLPTPNLTPGIWSGAGIIDQNNGIFNGITAGGLGYNGLDTIYPITYTHTDAFGCSNSDLLNVTITYGDTVIAGVDMILCVDDAPITLVGTPVGGVFSGPGVTGNTFDPSVGVGGGVFDIIYTQGTGTCEKSDTIQITVIDVTGTDAGNDEAFCYEDGLVTLGGQSPLGGVWSGPGIQDGNAGTFLTQAVSTGINPDTVQVCYTYTDALSGCNYTDCKNVIVRPLPVPNFTAVDTACVNQVITFNNASVDAISFQWYFGDGDSSNFLTPTHSYDTSGTYTVTLIAFSDFGCPDTITHDILIYETPQAGFTMSTNDGCGPLTVGFTNATSNQDQDISYSWDFGNGLTSTQPNPPAQTYNAGIEDTTYVVSLTVTNLCGSTTFNDSIIVRANPDAIMAADNNFGCGPLTVNFSNGSTGGPNSYLWNFGPFGASTDTVPPPVTFTIPDTFPVTYWVTLTATNACGTDVDSVPITVIPGSVNAGIGTDVTSGCEPLTVNFTSAVQMGDNVQWIFGDGNSSVQFNPTHVFDTVGIFTVYQIVTNQCGSDTATVDIEVFPQPPMDISHAPFTCLNEPMQFYNNSTPIAGTVWDFGDGNTSSLTNPSHTYAAPGFYTVYVTNYSITHLCPIVDSTVVEVKDIPNASFALDALDGCSPVTVNTTNNSTGIFSSWMFINGDNSDTTGYITTNPSHTFVEAGQHYVVLTTTDNFGCFSDTTITGIVVHPNPNAVFEPEVDQQCGLDATVLLNNLTTDADAYFWDFGNGTFSNVTHPTISYNNVGTQTISLEASNTFGCRDTMVQELEVYPSPFADYTLTPQYGCEPLTVQFEQLAINTNQYYWRFGDGDTSVQANPIHTYSAGKYDVTFIASIDGVCFDSIKLFNVVHAEGSPIADFEIIQSDPDNPTGIIQFVNNSIGANRYEWEFGDGTFSNEENPSKEYLENGQRIVRLIAWNEAGCTDTLIQIIDPIEFKGLFVPNAFSPDAGIGDVRLFKPVGVNIQTYRAQVFSQWGELLWQSEALDDAGRPTEGWDGIYNGTPMPQGAYVWKVEAVFRDGSIWEGQKNTLGQTRKMGSVTLLR